VDIVDREARNASFFPDAWVPSNEDSFADFEILVATFPASGIITWFRKRPMTGKRVLSSFP
jgi:hypothetical protein